MSKITITPIGHPDNLTLQYYDNSGFKYPSEIRLHKTDKNMHEVSGTYVLVDVELVRELREAILWVTNNRRPRARTYEDGGNSKIIGYTMEYFSKAKWKLFDGLLAKLPEVE